MFLNCAVACPESSMNEALESGWVWGVWRGPSSRSMGWGVTGKVKGSIPMGRGLSWEEPALYSTAISASSGVSELWDDFCLALSPLCSRRREQGSWGQDDGQEDGGGWWLPEGQAVLTSTSWKSHRPCSLARGQSYTWPMVGSVPNGAGAASVT